MTASQPRSPAQPPRRISGPGELLQAVPYLLGFHPTRSLVLVGLRDGLLVVTARVDLDDVPFGVVAHTVETMARAGSAALIAAVYDDRAVRDGARALPWRQLADLLDHDAERAGCEVIDVLLVAGGRWWPLTCDTTQCCPAEGWALPADPSPFAAAATYDGVAVLPDRAALAALLDPAPDDERGRLDELLSAAEDTAMAEAVAGHSDRWARSAKRALIQAARKSDEPGWAAPADPDVARHGVALSDIAVRDAAWLAVDDGRIDGRALWRELGRRLPGPYDAAPLFLFGWAAWRAGDGASARIAADRAVMSDPQYSAADLLLAALRQGLDPRRVPKLRLRRSA